MSKTQTKGIYGHLSIGLTFLKAMIEENGNHGYIVAEDGRPVSDEDALRMIDDDLAHGKTFITPNCPTPKANGACPTHSKGGA